MSCIAIITARGGSKRIPKKNIKDFMGKPMLAYAIEAALKSGIFDEVMVSTDSDEIAEIAKKNGAKVPFMRSAETSNDFAITYDVLKEVITEYKNKGKEFDYICCIYPCVPFLTADTLKKSFEQMRNQNANAIYPVCKYPAPIEWAMVLSNGYLEAKDLELQKVRSQDLEPTYYDAGMFYFYKTDIFLTARTTLFPKTTGYVIDESECQDIDTMEDWKEAENKYRLIRSN